MSLQRRNSGVCVDNDDDDAAAAVDETHWSRRDAGKRGSEGGTGSLLVRFSNGETILKMNLPFLWPWRRS